MENALKFVPLNADGSAPFVEVCSEDLELIYNTLISRGYDVIWNMAFLLVKGDLDMVVFPAWNGLVVQICDDGMVLFSSAEDFLDNYPAV